MKKIKITRGTVVAGVGDVRPGEEITVADKTAALLTRMGKAEILEVEEPQETAESRPNAADKSRRRRRRQTTQED